MHSTYSLLDVWLQLALPLNGNVDHVGGEIDSVHVNPVLPGEVECGAARPTAHVQHPLARNDAQSGAEILPSQIAREGHA